MPQLRPMLGVLVALVLPLCAVPAAAQQYDVIIRHGRVVDGTGNPWYYADVAVSGERIAAVGDLSRATAKREVDATGLYVAPGFIDVHSHSGPGLATKALSPARPLVAQGITTVFVNPDGGGPVDLAVQRAELLKDGLGVNVAQLMPHGSVRRAVLGMADRAPTPAELERMKGLVRKGMEEGAFGVSSGPFYAPGSYSKTDELVELAKVASAYGGAYTSHIRDESDYTVGLVAAVDEVITVAREAKLPGVVTHIKALGPHVWGYSAAIVERIDRAREQGIQVYADQYPYEASGSSLTSSLIPRWAEVGGDSALVRRLSTPAELAKIHAAMVENLDRRGGADHLQFRRFVKDPSIEGKTLAAVAKERGVDPLELAVELIKQGGAAMVSFNMNPRDVARFMRQPWTMTSTDGDLVPMGEGVPHPRSYGTYPRKLRKYVVEDDVVDLAFAVRSMTSLPATVFGVADRGQLRPGAFADVVVFDLARVRDKADYQNPHQLAEGMVDVLVNGRFAMDGGRYTDELGGRVLQRRPPRT
ncbi:MAG TPA: D-aminoacylase [Longimicrobiales bacterium]|nr:D-aminoacylase [Longimicrobiales bacterium]